MRLLPARTGFAEPVWLKVKSARALIALTTEAVLLAGLGSNSNGAAFAMFVADPVAVGFTVILTVAVAFLARFVRVHVTVATLSKVKEVPWVLVAERRLTNGDRTSVTVKELTDEGPLFTSLIV